MIVRTVIGLILSAAQSGMAVADVPPVAAEAHPYSDCVIAEIARLENTTPATLSSFSKKSARLAVRSCQSTKVAWMSALEEKMSSDPTFQNETLRKAEISKIVGEDDLAILLLINLKAK